MTVIKDKIEEFRSKVLDIAQTNGSGYITALLCEVFRFQFPYEIRFLFDERSYNGNNRYNFDVIQVNTLFGMVDKAIEDKRPVSPICYQCGRHLVDKPLVPGSTQTFYLCSACSSDYPDILSEDEMQAIHRAIQKMKGE